MLSVLLRWLPLALVAVVAFWLRTHELGRRPMHSDEANQAVKTGQLLETGDYAFDPRDHHGPTLYYAALPIAWLRGEKNLAELQETTVRLVPAIFGTLSVVLLAFLATVGDAPRADALRGKPSWPLIRNRWPALAAAAFLAVSPPAVYYSRFFIQETLLVAFTLATFVSAQRWWRTGKPAWALLVGVNVGLMQATKSSAPFILLAALLALPAARVGRPHAARPWLAAALALVAALSTAALLYSSFGRHPAGLFDAVRTYGYSAGRLDATTGHEKTWWYFPSLFWWRQTGGLVWQQLVFAALAMLGGIAAFVSGDRLLRWTAVYALALGALLSLPAYKTPWHALHLVPALALLAGGALTALARRRAGQQIASAAAILALVTLAQQTRLAAFQRPADERNPYAYVHSSPDVLKFRALAERAIARAPDQPLRIIAAEYWPLPWYLRGIANVGYWSAPPEDCDGALLFVSTEHAEAVRARLRGSYGESILGLRPGVLLVVFTPLEKD